MFRGSTKEKFRKSNVAHVYEKKMAIKRRWVFTFGKATRLQRVFLSSPSESSVASLRFSKEIRSSRLMGAMVTVVIMVVTVVMMVIVVTAVVT